MDTVNSEIKFTLNDPECWKMRSEDKPNEPSTFDTPDKAQRDIDNTLASLIRKGHIDKRYRMKEYVKVPDLITELEVQKKIG